MRKYMVCETKKSYHLIEVDEDVNFEEVIHELNDSLSKYDSGCEAISTALDKIKNTYGLDYEIKCNYCGTEIDGISIVDEVD